MASKLDPFIAFPVATLKARGPRVVAELMSIVQARADNGEETFADACSRLPKAWQATMLVAWAIGRLEEGRFLPEILQGLAEVDDRSLLIAALKEIGEKTLASAFVAADDVLDEPDQMWSGLGPPPAEDLSRLRKKVFVLVGSMSEPFPAAQ